MTPIARKNLRQLHECESQRFLADHPKSAALYQRAQSSLLGGVPMNWMKKWAGAFPIFVKSAKGAHFTDVDGRDYVDLCLGDTGAVTARSPDIVAEDVARRAKEGITLMLPTEDSLWVGEDLQRRFGLPYWQFTLTATDANRFSIRIAREITQRSKILVFHYCYHGTVDESFATLENGVVGPRRGNIGPPVNPAETTRVVEFNDLNALEDALKHHDVACILAEPAMTNVGIILPDDGYWPAARELARRYGSLLIAAETHTIFARPGGFTAAWKLNPDTSVCETTICLRAVPNSSPPLTLRPTAPNPLLPPTLNSNSTSTTSPKTASSSPLPSTIWPTSPPPPPNPTTTPTPKSSPPPHKN